MLIRDEQHGYDPSRCQPQGEDHDEWPARTVHVPYTLEQDDDGIWYAHAWLGSSGGANGQGATPDQAITDLREAVQMVIDEDGIPEQLARTLDLEVA